MRNQFRNMVTAGLCVMHAPATIVFCRQTPVPAATSTASSQQEMTVIEFTGKDGLANVVSEAGSIDALPASPDRLVTLAPGDVTSIQFDSMANSIGKTIHFRLHWTEVTERKESCKTIKSRTPKFRDFDIPVHVKNVSIKAILLQGIDATRQEILVGSHESRTLRVAVGSTLRIELPFLGEDVVFTKRQLNTSEIKQYVNPLLDDLRRANVENPHLDTQEHFAIPGDVQTMRVRITTKRGV